MWPGLARCDAAIVPPARHRGTNDLFALSYPDSKFVYVSAWLSRRHARVVGGALAILLLLSLVALWRSSSSTNSPPRLAVPTLAGLNYGVPRTVGGEWVGTQWLRAESNYGYWESTSPVLSADLDFIVQRNLGRVLRLFVGLDQAMVWKDQGFVGFDETALEHFTQTLDMLDARGMRVLVVLYDQQEVGSWGNFHFEALDGHHSAMRSDYLRATEEFFRRFGARQTVVGWDLFNEAYNSLGTNGHLPKPPHANPVSPNYSDQVVHDWLRDLYKAAKKGAANARLTVSDTTELYWNPDPDLSKYEDVVDFFDIHVYDDNPKYPDWSSLLRKPYIVGEAGASTANQHLDDQVINSRAVGYLLQHSQGAGVSAVLVQGEAFPRTRDSLTPTGAAVAGFLTQAGKSR